MKKTGEEKKSIINGDEVLLHLVTISETVREVNNKLNVAERHINYLKNLTAKEGRTLINLRSTTKALLQNAMTVAQSTIKCLESEPYGHKNEKVIDLCERLYNIMEKDSQPDVDNTENSVPEEGDIDLSRLTDKIEYMESKQKSNESIYSPASHNFYKSYRSDIDEKYPESCSRESLLDLDFGATLPPVPEGAFTDFKRPPRSCSLSSIKNIKKMKLTLRPCYDDNELDAEENSLGMDQFHKLQIQGQTSNSIPASLNTQSDDS
ncbi:uncharacterized protein LOC124158595 [Ischnura elegans]|uniref:uncharacterized protein LOC124158595 n=1 Tax=Ischnura elegans TaxID=197161 RepID=UPI001ED88ADE|nr:uncharacterized protein LOC124158595 [Ischnura elegans]